MSSSLLTLHSVAMREISPHPTGLPEANSRRALTPSSPQLLEQRRQEALAVAQQCKVILRDRCPVTPT
ncbi:MAG: hypothetical protein K6T90_11870 [Leptolyngbyaceae cyanobacterium HOT.MB2.61]|nr:hypothetical protein [Leptolyngbyaceae cyanobacterium HOT.MB2.61]